MRLSLIGPTASGKTELAGALARARPGCELVSIDAIAVYRGLDIGTAKPTASERAGVTWHLIDLVDPWEEFSVASFQGFARAAIDQIEARGHGVVLVGGTGLYHRAIVDELAIPPRFGEIARTLDAEAGRPGGLEQLYARLSAADPLAASRIEATNRRRIVRALEVCLGAGRPFSSFGPGLDSYPPSSWAIVGISLSRALLDARIATRLAVHLEAGFLAEVERLANNSQGLSRTAAQALGYRELLAHLRGEISLPEACAQIAARTRRFARRQEAWFRRDTRVTWLDGSRDDLLDELIQLVDLETATTLPRDTMTR